jgi:phosphinothricin acetyltransferase
MFNFRDATPADAGRLLDIYSPYVSDSATSFETAVPTLEEFASRITKYASEWCWLVAEMDGEIAGYAYGGQHRERAAYRWSVETSAYVHSSFQGRGLAKALYFELFSRLAERGYCNALAVIVLPNPASIRLHESVGFEPIGVFKRAGWKFGQWHDVAWYQRAIRNEPPCAEPDSAVA